MSLGFQELVDQAEALKAVQTASKSEEQQLAELTEKVTEEGKKWESTWGLQYEKGIQQEEMVDERRHLIIQQRR